VWACLSIPNLQGGAFKGRIFATHPTKAIMRLMLQNHIRTDSLR
jgi:Cft2 family RNA processing exonuclease